MRNFKQSKTASHFLPILSAACLFALVVLGSVALATSPVLLSSATAYATLLSEDATATISGVVTDQDLAPLPDISVYAYLIEEGMLPFEIDTTLLEPEAMSFTKEDGSYEIFDLPCGNYRLAFVDEQGRYHPAFNADASSLAQAPDIELAEGDVSEQDAVLVLKPYLSGTVYGEAGEELEGIVVRAYKKDPLTQLFSEEASVFTDEQGLFYFTDMSEGIYYLLFQDISSVYADAFWPGVPVFDQTCEIVFDNLTYRGGLDIHLGAFYQLFGKVSASTGAAALDNITVTLYKQNASSQWVACATTSTDAGGNYSLTVLSGTYRVGFLDPQGIYLDKFYPQGADANSATDLLLNSANSSVKADISLDKAAIVSGKVQNAQGSGVAGVAISLYRATSGPSPSGYYSFSELVATATSATDGSYNFSGLLPGIYTLSFDPPAPYSFQVYDKKAGLSVATALVLAAGDVKNLSTVLSSKSALSGTVKDSGGAALSAIQLELIGADGLVADTTFTLGSGTFLFEGLNPGTYRLRINAQGTFHNSAYEVSYYNDVATLGAAEAFSLSSAELKTLSVILPSAGSYGLHTITFVTERGICPAPLTRSYKQLLGTLPQLSAEGWIFTGWYSANTGGIQFTSSYPVTGPLTLYARWTQAPALTISFNAQGGSATSPKTIPYGAAIGALPPPPVYEHMEFLGWYSMPYGGHLILPTEVFFSDTTLYAQYKKLPPFTVSFDARGGSAVAAQKIERGEVLSFIPTPQKSGSVFAGWFESDIALEAVSESYLVTQDITLYARWTEVPPPGGGEGGAGTGGDGGGQNPGTNDGNGAAQPLKSSVSTLKSLKASTGKLRKKFAPLRLSYQLTLPSKKKSVTLTVVPSDSEAKVSLKVGKKAYKQRTKIKLSLKRGAKKIVRIRVSAQDGTVRIYKVTVKR